MIGADWTSWLWWSGGALLALAGVVMLFRALLWDWLRTRKKKPRRCPKCWYDLSGTESLTCSECGHTAKRERKLHKSRRRWRWVVVTPVMLLAAAFMAVQPTVYRDGWSAVVPTSALLWIACPVDESPIGEKPMEWVHNRIAERLFGTPTNPQPNYDLSWLQLRLIIDRGLQYRSEASPDYELQYLFATGQVPLFDQLLIHAFAAERNGSVTLTRYQERIRDELDFEFIIESQIRSHHWLHTRWILSIKSSWPGASSVAVEGIAVPEVPSDHPLAPELRPIRFTQMSGRSIVATTDAPPTGRHDVQFRVTARTKTSQSRASAAGSSGGGALLVEDRIVHSILEFEGLPPVHSAEVDAMLRGGLKNLELIQANDELRGVTIRFDDRCVALLTRMRLAVRVSLLLNGEEVATGKVLLGTPRWEKEQPPDRQLIGGVFFEESASILAELIDTVDDGWALVVEGDERLANQNLWARAYWAGRIEVPIVWNVETE